MRRNFILYIKRQKTILLLLTCFLFMGISAQAQWVCPGDSYFDLYPTSTPCANGDITMRADLMYTDPWISRGEFRWYNSATSNEILYSSYCSGDGSYSEYTMYATNGATIYVCVYDYNRGCETPRVPYTITFQTPLHGYLDYAQVCRNNIGEVHVVATGAGRMDLYKYNNGYEYVATSYDGYFSVPNPDTSPYTVYLYGGGGCTAAVSLYFFFFEFNDQTAPTITGNTTVCEGRSTVLYANSGHNQYWWYDAAGNTVYEGYDFHTPTNLTPGTYTYTARGGSYDYCTGNGTNVTITVNPKPIDGTISASTTTACVGQPVTISSQGGYGTPHYWASTDNGQSWNLFADAYVGQSGFQYTPTAPGTYRFHVRNWTSCGFCWDQPTNCPTFPYVDVVVSNASPSISGGSSCTEGGTVQLTSNLSGGSWSSSNTSVATVNANGVVTGIAAGTTTITYTFTNSCGTFTAQLNFTVLSLSSVLTGLGKGIDDMPNTSVIPMVVNGTPVVTKYAPIADQSLAHTIKNVLAFQVLEETNKYIPGDFTASVLLKVEYGHSETSLCEKNDLTLTVNYTKDAGLKYDALNYFTFENAEFTRVTVLDVQAPNTVNGVAFDTKEVLKLTNMLLSTRYYQMADNKKPDLTVPASLPATGVDALHVSWTIPANTNNNAVQLEWAWLEKGMEDDYKNSNNQVDPDLVLKAGATRIDLAEGAAGGSYNIPLLYDGEGTLYVRARAVNIMPSGSRSDGPWSDIKPCVFDGHENKLNWQVTTSYAEEGKRKTVIQYFDGTLRSRQTVTKDNTTGQTVVAETMYDMEGRPAVQILPAPGIDNIIAYRENLNKFNGQVDDTNPADYFDFTTSTSGYYATAPLDESLGTAKYYSVQNPDRNTGIHQNIPVANGYPYSVTRYTPDGTGRVLRQSGPGDSHKMESGHETLYFYGTPKQEELDALFGTEVGYCDHYFKNMVQDANGEMSVSYLDLQGRTIATALAGVSKQEALPGSGSSTYQDLTCNLLSNGSNLLKGNSIESVNSILVPYSTEYRFAYKLNKQTITLPACNGGTVTYDCKFDLQIAIIDETGEQEPIVLNNNGIFELDQTFDPIILKVGSYSVRKTLTINQAWLEKILAEYSADSVGVCSTLQQLTTTITDVDIQGSGCNLPTTEFTSSNCMSTLGTFETYRDNYAASINVAVGNLTPEQVSDIRGQYDAAVAFCSSLDPQKSQTLSNIRQQMLADMIPYTGQYADKEKTASKYNIFATSGGLLGTQPYYRYPRGESSATNDYYIDYGIIDQSVPAARLQGMSNDEFAEEFKESWAKALLKYHPEYNKLKFAEDNLHSSFDFIDKMHVSETPFDPLYDPDPNNKDPFFDIPGQADKRDSIKNYIYGSSGDYTMWRLAYGDAAGCKTILDNAQRNACYDNMPRVFTTTGSVLNTGATLTADMQSQAWTVYKALYTQVRNGYVNNYINESNRGDNNQSLIGEGYRLHFPKDLTEAAQSNANASNTGEWTSITPDAQGNFPNIDYNQTAAQYSHPCDSYINAWRQALLECPKLANDERKDEILNSIIIKMQEICRKGTDAANPYGSSSVAPAYNGDQFTSFEQVVLSVFGDNHIDVNELCHPYGIEFPKPYGMNPPITKQSISTVETCTCAQWTKLLQEMSQAGTTPSTLAAINSYLSATYKDTLTPGLYAGLLKCGQSFQVCTGTTDPDPCPGCRVDAAAPNTNCTYLSSIPLLSPQPLPYFLVCGYDKNIAKCYNCTAFVGYQTAFKAVFGKDPVFTGTVPDDMVVWSDLFAKYVNYKTGLQRNWLYYADKFNANACPVGGIGGIASNSDLNICRDNKPLNDATVDNPPSPCDAVRAYAKLKATIQYDYLKRRVMDDFRAAYIEKCVAATETFTVNYAPKEYHYTLYYYDRAGNLVRTVPPKGVVPDYTNAYLADVVAQRDKMQKGLPYTENTPNHTLDTRYSYNSLNNVVKQQTPDAGDSQLQQTPNAGVSQFWYDQLGRIVASQNPKQAAAGNVYSYTEYDKLGRVTQASQITGAAQLTDPISRNEGALNTWYNNAYSSQAEVVQTIYDLEFGVINGANFNQSNLRNRVSYTRVWNNIADPYPASATYYTYDVHGNVGELLQDYGDRRGVANIMNRLVGQNTNQFKKIVYDYDLISGKVNKVSYQPGEYDSYYHRYEYDGENRLTDVYSGRDEIMLNLFKEKEAHYNYYKHGLLASTTLGQLMVQKQDYAYTLHGWLKAVNPAFGGTLANGTNIAETNSVADAYGFSLHYFDNDYKAIGYTPQSNSILGSLGTKARSLYNGNIAAMAVNLPGVGLGASKVYNYHYDQLNRIVAMDAYEGLDVASGKFTLPSTQPEEYKERISYDANGNILSYLRNGDASRLSMDNLTYHYTPGTNKLHKVTDAADDASDANYSKYNDLRKNMAGQNTPAQNDNNYEYDLIGNLVKDHSENLEITWTSYGKIASISKSGVVTKFAYDASGNRILKETPSGSTAYVRDASGNVLSVYTGGPSGNVTQSEVHLYGSSRLGIVSAPGKQEIEVPLGCGFSSGINSTFTRGEKLFELNNHLGNVLTTVTDKRIAIPQTDVTKIDHYVADIASAQDYYPFGMIMPGRKVNAGGYRYGFNGKENDNDVKGEGNQQDYGMRIYDPRIGKFLSVDPITSKYPELTPYQFASNRPIDGIDEDGLEWAYVDKFNVQLHITDKSTDKERLLIAGVRWAGYDLAWGKPVPKEGTVAKAYTFGALGMTTFGVDAKGEGTKIWQSYESLSTGSASSDRKIGTLHSSIQGQMKSFILKANYRFGIDVRVTDGFRTIEEQDLIYAQSRSQEQVDAEKKRLGITRTIIARPDEGHATNAIGGYSNHNFGLAIDVVPFENGRLNWNTRKYPIIGLIGESRGLEWGHRWKKLDDKPHFQNLWGYSMRRLRQTPRDSNGLPILYFQRQPQ